MTEAVLHAVPAFTPTAPIFAEDPFQMSYRESKVFTASQEELILLLYDGALKFGQRGLEALDRGDKNAAHYNLLRAQKIVHYLDMSLNLPQGLEVAQNLARLYAFVKQRLSEGQRLFARETVEDGVRILRHLRETWQHAFASNPG